jgi:hypothetical protein
MFFFSVPAYAQDYAYDAPTSSMYLGVMILGGFVMMALIGSLIALTIYLMRKSRQFPRHPHRTRTRRPQPLTPADSAPSA